MYSPHQDYSFEVDHHLWTQEGHHSYSCWSLKRNIGTSSSKQKKQKQKFLHHQSCLLASTLNTTVDHKVERRSNYCLYQVSRLAKALLWRRFLIFYRSTRLLPSMGRPSKRPLAKKTTTTSSQVTHTYRRHRILSSLRPCHLQLLDPFFVPSFGGSFENSGGSISRGTTPLSLLH